MLLDGSQRRKRYGSIQQQQQQQQQQQAPERVISTSNESSKCLRFDIKSTTFNLGPGCLNKIIDGVKQTKALLISNNSNKELEATCNKSPAVATLTRNGFNFNLSDRSGSSARHFERSNSSMGSTINQIPSIRGTLQKTFSLQQGKFDPASVRLKYDLPRATTTTASVRSSESCVKKINLDPNKIKRKQCFLTGSSNNNNRALISSILSVIVHLCLICFVRSSYGAPIPIQFGGGSINLDDLYDSAGVGNIENLVAKDGRLYLERPEGDSRTWFPFGRELYGPPLRPIATKANDEDKKLGIQRRRLNRDRALEPAPWMRQQPMRRGYDSVEPMLKDDDTNESITETIPGRQMRQASDELLYDGILKYLLEEAVEGQDYLNGLYDELKQRSKQNARQNTAPNLGMMGLADGLQQDQIGRLSNKQKTAANYFANEASAHDASTLGLGADSGGSLVVAGDEITGTDVVASNDNPLNVVGDETHASLKAAYPGADDLDKEAVWSGDRILAPTLVSNQQSAQKSDFNSGYSAPVATTTAYDALDSLSGPSDGSSMSDNDQAQRYLSLELNPSSESFHVVEDVDRIDDLESSSSQQYAHVDESSNGAGISRGSTGGMQFIEPTDYIGPRGLLLPDKRDVLLVEPRVENHPAIELLRSHRALRSQKQPLLSRARISRSDYLIREQLEQVAGKLKSYMEQMIGLSQGSILGMYPVNSQQLLIKLDTSRLTAGQVIDLIRDYGFARSFIMLSWPQGSRRNPLPLLATLLNELARESIGLDAAGRNANNIGIGIPSNENEDENANDFDIDIDIDIDKQLEPNSSDEDSNSSDKSLSTLDDESPLHMLDVDRASDPILSVLDNVHALDLDEIDSIGVQVNKPRLSWATIRALIRLYANQRDGIRPGNSIEQLPGTELHSEAISNQALVNDPLASLRSNPALLHLFAILAALLGSFLAVKLIMKKQTKRMFARRFSQSSRSLRSFWSGGSKFIDESSSMEAPNGNGEPETINGITTGEKGCYKQMEACSNVLDRTTYNMTSNDLCDDNSEQDKKRLEIMVKRLVNILSGYSKPSAKQTRDFDQAKDTVSSEESKDTTDLESPKEQSELQEQQQQQSSYRTSRSYIKSLIDVLSNVRPFSSTAICEQDDLDQVASKSDIEKNEHFDIGSSAGSSKSDPDEQQDLVMSQMDITAAHLILAYMETHLEDKERLRREWLQLNGIQSKSSNSKVGGTTTNHKAAGRMSELTLQKLAKVALSGENLYKNSSPSVVPFDRNRVKLGTCIKSATAPTPAASKATNRVVAGNSFSGDYINASYIYDDDPSRPTHIIAQGPKDEQTSGHFWQMIWEQGISVIVMLTRLNENGVRQCHCYWPTNSGSSSSASVASDILTNSSVPSGNGQSVSKSLDEQQQQQHQPGTNTSPINGDDKQQQQQQAELANSRSPTSVPAHANEPPASISPTSTMASNAGPNFGGPRRTSVTSVFNMANTNRQGGQNGQPIIANKDLISNVIIFDVCSVDHDSTSSSLSTIYSTQPAKVTTAAAAAATSSKADRSNSQLNKPPTEQKFKSGAKPEVASNTNQRGHKQTAIVRFEVHLVSEHVSSNDYLVRNMCIVNRSTGETRTVTQFHYLAWPEGGVPDNPKNLLQFRRKVHKSYRNLKSPILVHCSDGAGRSGTYTLIDIILERIRKGAKEIDPLATLEHLRDQRVGLCANQSQFEFVLMALAEEIQIILNALPQ